MISKTQLKILVRLQKTAARKSKALQNVKLTKTKSNEQYSLFKIIADEKRFLNSEFGDINKLKELIELVHDTRHKTISTTGDYIKCKYCKNVLAEMSISLPGAPAEDEAIPGPDLEDELKPRYGNLIALLWQEVQDEVTSMEQKRMPSQNDLTRWALKEAVLRFYEEMTLEDDLVVVESLYNDRLITELAPDFSVIYKMWMEKLDELQRLSDKYALNSLEYDKAEEDMLSGMRGSAFEKQLDRYREYFMNKLKR